MDYRYMFQRDIGLVLDNYEPCQATLQALIVESGSDPMMLGRLLQEWFDASIAKALAHVPMNSDGYRLIAEITHNLPLSIFQSLAQDYVEAPDVA